MYFAIYNCSGFEDKIDYINYLCMPYDSYTSIYVEYDVVLCELPVLQLIHKPMYVVFGGDLNTDFSKDISKHTKSLNQ